jgi:hypothetical protein
MYVCLLFLWMTELMSDRWVTKLVGEWAQQAYIWRIPNGQYYTRGRLKLGIIPATIVVRNVR